ncbi:MAG TPA: hypothetical protein VG364_07435 [Candidatus Dormibacteraeota bacterium]|nr:hypothetical protein [Candidatus Dormibacteraeota bacterium]
METEPPPDGDSSDGSPDGESTDDILESLLVDDAEVRWDPTTGKPRVTRRRKTELDSPAGSG